MQFQDRLGTVLKRLFPDKEVFTNVKKSGNVVSSSSQRFLELDFWIPALKLALEYQDPHHYVSTWYSFGSRDGIQQRDSEKLKLMEERGDTLVLVPCWWDGQEDKLVATIRKKRPDLLSHYKLFVDPIDVEPPPGYFKTDCVPYVGELMLATFGYSAAHAQSWWVGEKYDGLRACWSSADHTLYSRQGRKLVISVLQKTEHPSVFLDGELWFGRGSYKELHGLLKRKHFYDTFYTENEEYSVKEGEREGETSEYRREVWENLRFVVFDCPIGAEHFEKRYTKVMQDASLQMHPVILIASIHVNTTPKHLQEYMKQVLEDGGEGIIVRKPKSPYSHGRSQDLLKFKVDRDQEAMVLSTEGDYFVLQLPTNHIVTTKAIDDECTRPKKGDIVTYTLSHLSSQEGIPQDVRILRIREDMTWHDVVRNEALELPRKPSLNAITAGAYSPKIRNPMGHWTENGGANVRRFFDDFAKRRKLDPLVPTTWHSVTTRDVLREGGAFLYHYKCSVFNAVTDMYPEVKFDPLKFDSVSRHFWSTISNVKDFFDTFAAKRGFDPLHAQNWYSYKQDDIIKEKNGSSALHHFQRSYPRALSAVYPQLSFDPKLFGKTYEWVQPASKKRSITSYWFSFANRKRFFDQFAEKRKFDPTILSNWKTITKEDLIAELGGIYVMKHYGGSQTQALRDIYKIT